MKQVDVLSVSSILEGCIERENMSVSLYTRALEIVKDPSSRGILKKLRSDEANHAKLLTAALEADHTEMIGNNRIAAETPSSEAGGKNVDFSEKTKPKEIIAIAIFHEEKAIDYFTRYVDTFRGTELGELFELLRKEEEVHRAKLIKMSEMYI